MRLDGTCASIRRLDAGDATPLLRLRLRNRAFFEPFEPLRDPASFTARGQEAALAEDAARWRRGEAYSFGILDSGNGGSLTGWVVVANVVRGSRNRATLGYAVDRAANGRGLATDAIVLAVGFAFGVLGLDRVEAAVLPANQGSARVLEKAGFRRSGRSRRYVQPAGRWADHDVFVLART